MSWMRSFDDMGLKRSRISMWEGVFETERRTQRCTEFGFSVYIGKLNELFVGFFKTMQLDLFIGELVWPKNGSFWTFQWIVEYSDDYTHGEWSGKAKYARAALADEFASHCSFLNFRCDFVGCKIGREGSKSNVIWLEVDCELQVEPHI